MSPSSTSRMRPVAPPPPPLGEGPAAAAPVVTSAPGRAPTGGDDPLLGRRAYEAIFAAIQGGTLRPGSRVRELALCDWLDMSRTPLRDALMRLQGEGLVRLEPHRGVVVEQLDRAALFELFEAREAAEGTAAELAARHATAAGIEELHRILALERASAGEPMLGSRHNRMLHEQIRACARNRFLSAHLGSLFARLALAGNATRRDPARVAEAAREHAELVDAIAARDPAAAGALARAHVAAARRLVLALAAAEEG